MRQSCALRAEHSPGNNHRHRDRRIRGHWQTFSVRAMKFLTTFNNNKKGAVALSRCRAGRKEFDEHTITRTGARCSLERSNASLYGCQHCGVLRAKLAGEFWVDSSAVWKGGEIACLRQLPPTCLSSERFGLADGRSR